MLTHCFLFFPAALVLLRTITSALSADEILSSTVVDNTGILQKILVYVVSVICNFVDIHPIMDEVIQLESINMESVSRVGEISLNRSTILKSAHAETILFWHQTTVISVMEAGGLNWLSGVACSFSLLIVSQLVQLTENCSMSTEF